MIVLDTNVLSEPIRSRPDDAVLTWMLAHDGLAVTSVSVAELLTGARNLPTGTRRDQLIYDTERILTGRDVLAFDDAAAREYARMQEARRTAGHPLATEDGMIAAIAATHGAAVATRNTRDFEGLGVRLINPWDAEV